MHTLSLSPEHFVVALPVAVVAAVGGFLVSHYLSGQSCKKGLVNTTISKDSPKVVHSFDMEDIGTKAVYCRCWKSKKVGAPVAAPVALSKHVHVKMFAFCKNLNLVGSYNFVQRLYIKIIE